MVDLATFKREYGLILVGAIVFTASFLWRDLMADIKDIYFPKYRGILGRAIFTLMVTVILVIIAIYIRDLLGLNAPTVTKIDFGDPDPIDRNPNDPQDVSSEISTEDSMMDIADSFGMDGIPNSDQHSE